MNLQDIYKPIEKGMPTIEKFLCSTLSRSSNASIAEINRYVLESPGKRLRPAMVLLSGNAVRHHKFNSAASPAPEEDSQLINIATAVELIHMASLVHDDVIDHSELRYNKPTINYKNGGDVAIALGDYLYSQAFDLITSCRKWDVIDCIGSATRAMCEGQLVQVCERDNIHLLKERYIGIVTKKTASLFAASCRSGALISTADDLVEDSLMAYGLNFGIAFQIIDDYLDLISEKKKLGKSPGQDFKVGEITLPILSLLESVSAKEKEELIKLLVTKDNEDSLQEIKHRMLNSSAQQKTKESVLYYINKATEKIRHLTDSPFKNSLILLTQFIVDRGFNGNGKT